MKAATAAAPTGEKKAKEKAAKDQVVPFVNMTPKGQKKGEFVHGHTVFGTIALGVGWDSFHWAHHAYLLLQICRGPWLQAMIQLPSKPPGMIGGLIKVSSSRCLLPTADPNPRVYS